MAMDKLERTMSGHYVLVVKRPAGLARGVHELDVSVKKRGATVLARKTVVDK
jgi:hypothetical protein